MTTQPTSVPAAERGISAEVVQVQPDAAALGQLAEQAAAGDLTVRVAAAVPLEDFLRGYELLARGGLSGKVVVLISLVQEPREDRPVDLRSVRPASKPSARARLEGGRTAPASRSRDLSRLS